MRKEELISNEDIIGIAEELGLPTKLTDKQIALVHIAFDEEREDRPFDYWQEVVEDILTDMFEIYKT